MKSLMSLVLAVLMLGGVVSSVRAAAPSSGATISDRKVPTDGAGAEFTNPWQMGFKVWEDSGTTVAQLVLDENGNAPGCGLLHQVCTAVRSATTSYVGVYDSTSTSVAGVTLNAAPFITDRALLPFLPGSTTLMTCSGVIDAQFNRGLVVATNVNDGASYVYWRPCRGGRN